MIIEKYKDKIEEKLDYITIADFIPVDFLKDYFDDIMIKYNKFNFVSSFYNYKFSIQTIIDNLDKIENNEYGIGINLLKKLLRNCCIQKNLCMLYEENKELGLEKMNIIKN